LVKDSDEPRTKLADKFSLSESTIQSWRRGSEPYALRGLDRAFERGWITPAIESQKALGLTALLAWVLAQGSIRKTFLPVFGSWSEDHHNHFKTIADEVGFSWSSYDVESTNYETELRPEEDGSVLGRVLYALGAIRTTDTFGESLIPPYVFHNSAHARRFVHTWCLHHSGDDTPRTVTVPSRLGEQFPTTLKALITDSLSWSIEQVTPRELVITDGDLE
jgi:hypothetical protein